ncbi:YjbF family lipoprotein [Roseomonas terrae]|uniref:YjbF family lipoprotein n=1 Tax=Neoroseomonas terrae TaxID=424799 RepID=A0ABS5ENC6_9PROT|nr:YjbF family lipoprotein [Neoroseomonas terrae]MBR0652530.1 YjbF family lipoprotein [Neoroseomonas terrae]
MRRFAVLALLLTGACGSSPDDGIVPSALVPTAVTEALFGTGEPVGEWENTPSEPADGEPALRLHLGSRRGIATLLQEEGDRRLWRTPGGVAVATDGARVVATAGLRQTLAATRFDGTDLLARLPELGEGQWRATRVVDLMRSATDPTRMRFGVRLDCRMTVGPAPAEETLLVTETCRGGASFTSRFWVDARSYAVFRSEQWVGDDLPPLVVEVVTAPATPTEIIPLPR